MSVTDDVLLFIMGFIEEKEYPPTVRDIHDGMGFSSTSVVHRHLKKLKEQKRIVTEPGRARAIKIVDVVLGA